MGTANIIIEEDLAAARAFAEASSGEQQELQLLLSLRPQELTDKPGGTLQSVMDETGRAAESRGLTPEILENLSPTVGRLGTGRSRWPRLAIPSSRPPGPPQPCPPRGSSGS